MANRNKVMVFCSNHDGFQAFFMLSADDFRVASAEALKRSHYVMLDSQPVYVSREKLLATKEGAFQVMSDWSLRPICVQAKACAERMKSAYSQA